MKTYKFILLNGDKFFVKGRTMVDALIDRGFGALRVSDIKTIYCFGAGFIKSA